MIRGSRPLGGGRLDGRLIAAPTVDTEAGPFFCRGRSQTGPQLRTSYRLFGQTRRSRGTAPAEIFANSGPVARNKTIKATQILRAGNSLLTHRYASPVMGSGKATMSTKCSSGAVPGGSFGFFSHRWERNSPPGRRNSLRIQQTQSKICPHPPQCAHWAPFQHWGTFPPGGTRMEKRR